jgi:sigma-B regulation protein RsbU (phosphoserine phosphatase)
MRILVAWDDPTQFELLQLYLAIGGENEVEICGSRGELYSLAHQGRWDVALFTQTLPTADECYTAFRAFREKLPGVPVVLATRAEEMVGLPRFLKAGLSSYIIRDERGDFMFLVLCALESAVEAEKARHASFLADILRQELDGVRKLQETIIPRGIHCQKGYRAVARYEPSEVNIAGDRPVVMAGGDYYEVFPTDSTDLVALIGDASGHGLKACMSIITMHTLIRMITDERYANTGAFVTGINRKLCDSTIVQSDGGFITLFYTAIDTTTHEMRWTSAGHPPALIHDRSTNTVTPVGGDNDDGLPLGISADITYDVLRTTIPPGGRVLIFSDGLTDALAPSGGGMFGVAGICQTLQACRDRSLEETLDALFRDSRDYTCGDGRHDDTSVVLVERE